MTKDSRADKFTTELEDIVIIKKKQITINVEKGGAGSGHWGHAGRPGKLGGSLPGSVALSIRTGPTAKARQAAAKNGLAAYKKKLKELKKKKVRDADEIDFEEVDIQEGVSEYWDTLGMNCEFDDFAAQAYNYHDEKTGWTARLSRIELDQTPRSKSPDETEISIRGDVYKPNGESPGYFRRTIFKNSDGKIEVHNDMFVLDSGVGGKGFGSRFYKNAEETYLQAGVDMVTIHANLSVGGYAWARMGYDFTGTFEREFNINRYNNNRYVNKLPLDTPAYKIAVAPGGKDFLLGSNWHAVKNMDPDDEGFLVGYHYMSLKD